MYILRHCLELVYHKDHSNLTEIFVLRLFKIVPKQSTSFLNRGLSCKSWWLISANHVKFIKDSVLHREK